MRITLRDEKPTPKLPGQQHSRPTTFSTNSTEISTEITGAQKHTNFTIFSSNTVTRLLSKKKKKKLTCCQKGKKETRNSLCSLPAPSPPTERSEAPPAAASRPLPSTGSRSGLPPIPEGTPPGSRPPSSSPLPSAGLAWRRSEVHPLVLSLPGKP